MTIPDKIFRYNVFVEEEFIIGNGGIITKVDDFVRFIKYFEDLNYKFFAGNNEVIYMRADKK